MKMAIEAEAEAEPTEGEWTHEDESDCILNDEGLIIAELIDGTGHQKNANGRLMAASKDLLAACETIAKELDGDSILIVSQDSIDKVKAAIAKARGRT